VYNPKILMQIDGACPIVLLVVHSIAEEKNTQNCKKCPKNGNESTTGVYL
jgi:hypothetical protein